MTQSQRTWLCVAVILLVPAAVATWSYYRPDSGRDHVLAEARQAAAGNRLDEAAGLLRRLLQSSPERLDAQLLYTQVLRRLGRDAEARQALDRAMQLGLPEKDGLREAALIEASQDVNRVGGTLEQLLHERPDDAEVMEVLARAYIQRHQEAEAEPLLTRLLELQPGRADLRLLRAFLRRGRKHFGEAAADYRDVLRQQPADFQACLLLADCLLSDARVDEAEKVLLQCRRLRPESPDPLVPLAACALERGDLDGAQAILKEARQRQPNDAAVLNEQATVYLLHRQYELALPLLEQVLRLDARNKVGHLKLAQALRQKGDLKGAQEHERRYQELEAEEEKQKLREKGFR